MAGYFNQCSHKPALPYDSIHLTRLCTPSQAISARSLIPIISQDPTNGFVFVPGSSNCAAPENLIDPGLEMPYTQQWNLSIERQMPFASALRVSYTGNRGIGLLRYSLINLPLNDPSGVLVTNHPNNAPAVLYTAAQRTAGDPRGVDVRGQVLRPAANILCAGTGLPGIAVSTQCPVAVPLGPLEYSLLVPRTNERRPDGRFTTNTRRLQRLVELLQRASG